MLPIVLNFLRVYAPYVTLPIAGIIGFIGYNLEDKFFSKPPPSVKSVEEAREDRLLSGVEKIAAMEALKEKKFVPRTIFEKNVSPSLK